MHNLAGHSHPNSAVRWILYTEGTLHRSGFPSAHRGTSHRVFSLNDALDASSDRVNAPRRAQLLRCADGSAWRCAGGKEGKERKGGQRIGRKGKERQDRKERKAKGGQEAGDSNCYRCSSCPGKTPELSACTFTHLLWSGLHTQSCSAPSSSPPRAQTETTTLSNTTAGQTAALSQVGAVPGAVCCRTGKQGDARD